MKNAGAKPQIKVIVGGAIVRVPKSAMTPMQSSATCVCRDCSFPQPAPKPTPQ